jgi:hypothetical protein
MFFKFVISVIDGHCDWPGVYENRVLRIFGLRRDEMTGEWSKLHNEYLNDLYCSLNIVRKIKSRRMRWAEHVWGRGRGYTAGMSNMRPFASTPAARTKDTVNWSFNGQNCSFYILNWINVRRSQKNGPMLFFIQNVFYTWK